MACKCAKRQGMFARYECKVTGDECVFLIPNARSCASIYGEGPESNGLKPFEFNYCEIGEAGIHATLVHGKDVDDAKERLKELVGEDICDIEVVE